MHLSSVTRVPSACVWLYLHPRIGDSHLLIANYRLNGQIPEHAAVVLKAALPHSLYIDCSMAHLILKPGIVYLKRVTEFEDTRTSTRSPVARMYISEPLLKEMSCFHNANDSNNAAILRTVGAQSERPSST